jgi:uncharacterized protein YunC (DUF1805 family)
MSIPNDGYLTGKLDPLQQEALSLLQEALPLMLQEERAFLNMMATAIENGNSPLAIILHAEGRKTHDMLLEAILKWATFTPAAEKFSVESQVRGKEAMYQEMKRQVNDKFEEDYPHIMEGRMKLHKRTLQAIRDSLEIDLGIDPDDLPLLADTEDY